MSDNPVYATATPEEQQQRRSFLRAICIFDTPPEEGFDALTRLAANVCDAPIAIVSLIDGSRLWFKSIHGSAASAIDSRHSFCCEAANSKRLLEVADPTLDPRFANNGLVTGELAVRYYAGAPIMYEGVGIGTVCVLDRVPRTADARQLQALSDLASIAAVLLKARVEAFRMFSDSRTQEPATSAG